MTKQRPNTPAPAPVAPLPPRGPQCREPISRPPGSVPFSMPRSVPFSMPIDTGEAIHVGRRDARFGIVDAHVSVTHVVGEDRDDVG